MSSHRLWSAAALAVALLGAAAAPAAADPSPTLAVVAAPVAVASVHPHAAPRHRHAIYLELLGRGGLWGVGYDVTLGHGLAVGAAASFYVLDGQRVTSLSPYVGAALLGRGHHHWFAQLGPQLVHVATPSPVPEWPGTSSTGVGGELTSGWEYRDRVVVRVFGMVVVGRSVSPWAGVSLGWTL